METIERDGNKICIEEVTKDSGTFADVKDVLQHTMLEKAIVITHMSGPTSIVALQEYLREHEDEPVFYALSTAAIEGEKPYEAMNRVSTQANIISCIGFEDVSDLVGSEDYRLLLCKNKVHGDVKCRICAYFAGAFMSSSSFTDVSAEANGCADSVYLKIFADCFAGGKNGRVLDFMNQMCKALGRGSISSTIHKALDGADRIRQYEAEKSSVF